MVPTMYYRSSWQASMSSSVVFSELPSALMPGQTHSVAPTTVPELYSILKWNLTKGHTRTCTSLMRTLSAVPTTECWVQIPTSKRVPWLLTIDSTVCTKGVISSLATNPVYWLQLLHCLLGSGKDCTYCKAVASGRSQTASADSLMKYHHAVLHKLSARWIDWRSTSD